MRFCELLKPASRINILIPTIRARYLGMLFFTLPCLVNAASFSGIVTNESGELLEGAIVTIIDKNLDKKFSVYTDAGGRYQAEYDGI